MASHQGWLLQGESTNLSRQGREGRGKAQVKQLLAQRATKKAILVKNCYTARFPTLSQDAF